MAGSPEPSEFRAHFRSSGLSLAPVIWGLTLIYEIVHRKFSLSILELVMALLRFFVEHRSEVLTLTWQHLVLVLVGTGAAVIAGVPLGIFLSRRPSSWSRLVLGIANVIQTVPSLALFGFLIPLLGTHGIGRIPAMIALFLYSLLPIIQNTLTGIKGIDPAVREAARAMGMTDWQLLTQVEIPLSLSVIVAGIRVATVISVGTATIAAAIGAGGLGMFIFRGLRMNDNVVILAGAVPAALMAVAADFLLSLLERGMRLRHSSRVATVRRWVPALALVGLILLGLFLFRANWGGTREHPVVIGSKDFTEQVILGELISQQIERQTGLQVERRFELAGDLCHRALVSGEIDGYVEYTGTALTTVLKHRPMVDAREVYELVKKEYRTRFGLEWLRPLGFNNTFAVLVRGRDAHDLHLTRISDLVPLASRWRAGFGQDFMSRPDGYPGLVSTYGLRFSEPPREMDLALTYRALAEGQVDVIAGNSTDGLIEKLRLVRLADDRHYFPPYEAAPVFREVALTQHPEIAPALDALAGKISDEEMRRLNYAADAEHQDIKKLVSGFLDSLQNPGR